MPTSWALAIKACIVFLLHLAFFSCHLPLAAACPNLPSMSVEDACRTATGTTLMYELCRDALRDVSYPSNGVDLYALVAAKRALASYDGTVRAAGDLLRGNGLAGDERNAYELCVEVYGEATGTMQGVAGSLVGCQFGGGLGEAYEKGIAQLERCRDKLMKLPPSTPLYAMNLLDRDKAVLAYFLARLLGIN